MSNFNSLPVEVTPQMTDRFFMGRGSAAGAERTVQVDPLAQLLISSNTIQRNINNSRLDLFDSLFNFNTTQQSGSTLNINRSGIYLGFGYLSLNATDLTIDAFDLSLILMDDAMQAIEYTYSLPAQTAMNGDIAYLPLAPEIFTLSAAFCFWKYSISVDPSVGNIFGGANTIAINIGT